MPPSSCLLFGPKIMLSGVCEPTAHRYRYPTTGDHIHTLLLSPRQTTETFSVNNVPRCVLSLLTKSGLFLSYLQLCKVLLLQFGVKCCVLTALSSTTDNTLQIQ